MHILGGGVFLVACRSECLISTLKGGKRSSICCWLLADRNARFTPLKEGETPVNFFVGAFLALSGSK
jgi:hypothetical protein